MEQLFHYILHIDIYLLAFISHYGAWTYIFLFLIIFCETGLVVTPFLPGDSLLFAAGSIAAQSGSLKIQFLYILLLLASVLGNKTNYLIGRYIGPKLFTKKSILFNQNYLDQAHQFYDRHGGKTLIFARFLPIIRTFAPFVAGMSNMNMRRFLIYNTLSAFFWVSSLLGAGYFFGSLPFVKENFSLFIYGIIALSLLPPCVAFCYRAINRS